MNIDFDSIMNGFIQAQIKGGAQAGLSFLDGVNTVLSIPDSPSPHIVESALHMANTELARQIDEHRHGGSE